MASITCKCGKDHARQGKLCAPMPYQDAIDALGAVEVAPGKWAFPYRYGKGYGVATRRQLATLVKYREKQSSALAYELWILGNTVLVDMPSWWTPERRVAWRVLDGSHDNGERYESCSDANSEAMIGQTVERITASLETGEEVSA